MQQNHESPVVVPIPDQLYLAVRDVIYGYKEWAGKLFHMLEYYSTPFLILIAKPINLEWCDFTYTHICAII